MMGMGVAISSLLGWRSNASSRSKVNIVGLGRDLTDLFLVLASVGNLGEGRGFSNGEPGGGEILLSWCAFDRIEPRPGDGPGLAPRGRRRGEAYPATCCSQLHKELLEECGVSGRGGRCVIRWRSSLLLTMIIGWGIFFVEPFDIHGLPLRRFRSSVLRDGLGLPLPSVTFKLAFSSLSQKRSSSEFCRRCGMSLRMLKFDRDNIVYGQSAECPEKEKGMKR